MEKEIDEDLKKTLDMIKEGKMSEILNDNGKGVTNMDNLHDGETEESHDDFSNFDKYIAGELDMSKRSLFG